MGVRTVAPFITFVLPIIVSSIGSPRSLQSENTNVVTNVNPIDCATNSGPLQTLRGETEYSVNEGTLEGDRTKDRTVFTIPYARSSPAFKRMNACGINPVDNILYCIIEISSISYLVRIDANQVEFVAKMPVWSWGAAFGFDGTYYFVYDMKYYKVTGANELKGHADQNAKDLTDLSSLSPFASLGFGADLVVVSADIDGQGKTDYIMTLTNKGKLRVTRATGTPVSWLLQSKPELPVTNQSSDAYGSAWAYQNRPFFSQNSGSGIYEALLDSIDLLAGTIVVERVGPSFTKGSTDGMNCIKNELPAMYSGRCGKNVGAYSALTGSDPVPKHGATDVRPSQELMFLPSHDDTVTGYQVFLGPATLNADGSVDSVEWHLACNLPCGVNVCRPPYGLDNTLGGNFAWRVDHLKSDGSSTTGEVWQFSLMASITYDTRAVADTYIDKKEKEYADKRHMLMWSRETKNPRFGFVKFDIPPPTYAGVDGCSVSVMSAQLRLVVLSFPMQDVSVYRIAAEEADFDEFSLTGSATGKHPGGTYPDVFKDSVLEQKVYGPVAPYENFTIDVTGAVSEAFDAGSKVVSFGLETSTRISRFCSQSKTNPRGTTKSKEAKEVISADLEAATWCYPRLEVVLGGLNCPAASQELSCSLPEGSPAGPLDAMCGTTPPTFPASPVITDWRDGTAITTTTTTTTTTTAPPIKEGRCRYNDHVTCPWPHSDTMCSGDQCCPDGSTCPSSQFTQAQGCNLKKYDCTAFLPANLTCRESDEVFCPGTDEKCSGDTCCSDGTTCPSASVAQVPGCGEKRVDCQALLSADSTCAVGEFVFCPGSDAKCHGNQCCPDGSTCPSAPAAIAEGCGPKKKTCELLSWDVNLRVTSVVFAKVDEDTMEEVEMMSQAAMANAAGVDPSKVDIETSAGSLIITAKVTPPGGWSQRKFDDSVQTNLMSEEMRLEMEEMLYETDGLKDASAGAMEFEAIKGERSDAEESTTAAPPLSGKVGTEAPGGVQSTSLRGSDTELAAMASDKGDEVSSAASWSLLLALAIPWVGACQLSSAP